MPTTPALHLTVLWSRTRDHVDMLLLNGKPLHQMRGATLKTLHYYLASLQDYGWEPNGVTTATERIETHYFKQRNQPGAISIPSPEDDRITQKPRRNSA